MALTQPLAAAPALAGESRVGTELEEEAVAAQAPQQSLDVQERRGDPAILLLTNAQQPTLWVR